MTFLPPADVQRITKRTKFAAQRRQLERLGIKYQPAADGEPLVRADYLDDKPKPARNHGPRWDRIAA